MHRDSEQIRVCYVWTPFPISRGNRNLVFGTNPPSIHRLSYTHNVSQCVHSCQVFFSGKNGALEYNAMDMRKDTALSIRVPQKLKAELEQVALKEGRSISQVCEALLSGGIKTYQKRGSRYIQRFLSRGQGNPQDSS